MDGKIAIIQCGGRQALPNEVPAGFTGVRLESLDEISLLEYAAIVFIISDGRRRCPKWLDHGYLMALGACGLKTVVLAEMTVKPRQLAPLMPPEMDIYQFEKETATCWGLEVEDDTFDDVRSAEVRFCFIPNERCSEGYVVPLVSRKGSASCVAFVCMGRILYLQGSLGSLAGCIRGWAHKDMHAPIGALTNAPAAVQISNRLLVSPSATDVSHGPSMGVGAAPPLPEAGPDPEGDPPNSTLPFRTLFKAALFLLLACISVTKIPGWLCESQKKNNQEQRTRYFKTKVDKEDSYDDEGREKEQTLRRVRFPSYRIEVSELESTIAGCIKTRWGEDQWEKFVLDVAPSTSWGGNRGGNEQRLRARPDRG